MCEPRPTLRRSARRGRRRAPSLPVKLRSFTIAEINERPFFRAYDQFLPNGILQNVIRLFATAFVLSQPMLKEIALPYNAEFFGRPFLPFADDQLQWFS
jgi:hypothetical protein